MTWQTTLIDGFRMIKQKIFHETLMDRGFYGYYPLTPKVENSKVVNDIRMTSNPGNESER